MPAKYSVPITLKTFSDDNIEATFDWLQNAELRQLFAMKEAPTWGKHVEYIKKILHDCTQVMFAIYYGDTYIGNCGLKYIQNQGASIWIYLGNKNYRKKGLSKVACRLLMNYARDKLKVNLLYLHVLKDNIVALNLYHALGFKEVPLGERDLSIWKERSDSIQKMVFYFK
jgi:RimJ/RimL family protein N-acetyltransferase